MTFFGFWNKKPFVEEPPMLYIGLILGSPKFL
jgi:hypothetical protein